MNEEKQIEEMALTMVDSDNIEVTNAFSMLFVKFAEALYNAGYRKQSGWISVEERLPETEGWYLVYTAPDKKHRSVNKAEFCKGFEWNNFEPYWRGAGGNWGNVTHWMPLPEPPVTKGA